MQISHDYLARKNQILIPLVINNVDDDIFTQIIKIVGEHQRFIDISRCILLTPLVFDKLMVCSSLYYLDISYTAIENISVICNNLFCLKSLNLSGLLHLEPNQFKSLEQLVNLEYLTLRGSSINSLDPISGMVMLRGLDFGQTQIDNLSPLGNGERFTRLEELVLDGCEKFTQKCIIESLKIFQNFTALRLLNINDTEFDNWEDQILEIVPKDVCIEPLSKRLMFLDFICNNNIKGVESLINCGIDINMITGEWTETFMLNTWLKRCRSGKLQSPCFLVSHEDKDLRPSPIHFAIMFNCEIILRLLIRKGANIDSIVWFSDVLDINKGKLVPDEELSATRDSDIFSTNSLPSAVYARNTHRLTGNMVELKTSGWKSICYDYKVLLEKIIDDPLYILPIKKKKNIIIKDNNENGKDDNDNGNNNINNNEEEEGDYEYEKPQKKSRNIVTLPKPIETHWQQNSLVSKLIGTPIPIDIKGVKSGNKDVLPYLGKKIFKMESRRLVLDDKLLLEENLFLQELEAKLSLLPIVSKEQQVKILQGKSQLQIDLFNRKIEIARKLLIKKIYDQKKIISRGIGYVRKAPAFPAAYQPTRDGAPLRKSGFLNTLKKRADRIEKRLSGLYDESSEEEEEEEEGEEKEEEKKKEEIIEIKELILEETNPLNHDNNDMNLTE